MVKVETDGQVFEIEIPQGYRRVWSGVVIDGDLYLDRVELLAGRTVWGRVARTAEQIAARVYGTASWFICVIREGAGPGPDKACEGCEVRPARFGYRFCQHCLNKGEHHAGE